MPSLEDVRAIALALPETFERIEQHSGWVTWRVGSGGAYAWQREPRKNDVAALEALGQEWPRGVVLAVRTDGQDAKQALLETFPEAIFTIPHFNGFPAVLVRLDDIEPELLAELVSDAWLTKAPKRVAKEWLARRNLDE